MTMHKQGLFREIRACVWYNEKGQKILVKDHTSIFTPNSSNVRGFRIILPPKLALFSEGFKRE